MTLEVGARITPHNFHELPPGSVTQYSHSRYLVLSNGYAHCDEQDWRHPIYHLGQGTHSVVKVGDEPVPKMNPAAFLQRVATVCYGGAMEGGVSMDPVFQGLTRINAPRNPPLGVGMWVHASDTDLRSRLHAAGAVFEIGDPNWWDTYGRWNTWDRHSKVDGGLGRMPKVLRVASLHSPETEEYLTPPTQEDEGRIAELRGQVWVIGERAKRDHNWCASFEATVSTLGVGAHSAQTITATTPAATEMVGRVADTDVIRRLPEGAILGYPASGNFTSDWNWVMRHDDSGRGPTMTRNLMGPNSGHWAGSMMVLWDGTGPMNIPIPSTAVMDAAPIGTTVRDWSEGHNGWRSSTVFTKNPQGWQSGSSTIHPASAFFSGDRTSYRFASFPMPGRADINFPIIAA